MIRSCVADVSVVENGVNEGRMGEVSVVSTVDMATDWRKDGEGVLYLARW